MKLCPRQLVIGRTRRSIFLVLLGVALSLASEQRPGQEIRRPPVTGVAAVGMTVADTDRAIDFYVDTLGFEKVVDTPMGPDMRWVEVKLPGTPTTIAQ